MEWILENMTTINKKPTLSMNGSKILSINKKPTLLMNGSKILSMKFGIGKIIDSVSFLPMALEKFPRLL